MVSVSTSSIALTTFLQQPETKPAQEFLQGEIIQKPMPQGKHSRIQAKLTTSLNQALEPIKVGMAFPELRCTFVNRSIVPDIAVIKWDRIPVDNQGDLENVISFCPDWIIEILSPEQSQTKLPHKLISCLQQGCEMGWLIDPTEKTVLVFPAQAPPSSYTDPQARIPVPAFAQAFELTVTQLFSWIQIKP